VRFSTFRSDIYIPPFGEHVFGSAVESRVQRYLSAMQVSGDIINIISIDRPMTPIGWTLIISKFPLAGVLTQCILAIPCTGIVHSKFSESTSVCNSSFRSTS
jgi:hypothetical protein